MRKTGLIMMVFGCLAVSLAGCSNTFDGAGRDMENMGEWVQDTF